MRSIGSIWKATLKAMAHPYRQSLSKVSTVYSYPSRKTLSGKGARGYRCTGTARGRITVLKPERRFRCSGGGPRAWPALRRRRCRGRQSRDGLRANIAGPDDAPPRPRRERSACLIEGLALLHLDKGKPLAFERHEIDLAHRRLVARAMMRRPLRRSSSGAMASAKSP